MMKTHFCPNLDACTIPIPKKFPVVIKIGSSCAGCVIPRLGPRQDDDCVILVANWMIYPSHSPLIRYGKMKIDTASQLVELKGCLYMHKGTACLAVCPACVCVPGL